MNTIHIEIHVIETILELQNSNYKKKTGKKVL